jgi:hypothetical protein
MEPETMVQRIEAAERRMEMLQEPAENLTSEQQGLIAEALEESHVAKRELRGQREESSVARQETVTQAESAQANWLLRALSLLRQCIAAGRR